MTSTDLPARPAASSGRRSGVGPTLVGATLNVVSRLGHGRILGDRGVVRVWGLPRAGADMSGLRIRPAVPADRAGVADLLRGLSAESAYRRFQTGLGPDPGPAILDALLPEDLQGGAVLAYVGRSLVGHGVWRRAGATPVAEIGLVVADAYQGQGIGTALATALLDDLADQGVERVEVFTGASNRAVIRMVTRFSPDAASERDGATVTYRFPTMVSATRTVA